MKNIHLVKNELQNYWIKRGVPRKLAHRVIFGGLPEILVRIIHRYYEKKQKNV